IKDLYKRLIMKAAAAPVGTPWMWTLAFGHHEDRTPTHGYAESREAAMTAFAKSWRTKCGRWSKSYGPSWRTSCRRRNCTECRLCSCRRFCEEPLPRPVGLRSGALVT